MSGRTPALVVGVRAWRAYVLFWLAVWVALVVRPGAWLIAVAHWPMAVVMILGSMVAGSTPMGGGSISFPALVLGFGRTPAMARDFGLAIQAVGMSSALVFIFTRRIPLAGRLLTWTCLGAIAGLTFGTVALAGRVEADAVKLLFATLWITFGAWLVTGETEEAPRGPRPPSRREVAPIGLCAGFLGGAVMSLIGVGPEMVVYAALVLRFGWRPRAAVPTAVCATALMAPVGFLLRVVTAGVDPGVFPDWMAAMPIVVFGAPAGAYVATRMPRVLLLRIIGALCLIQFVATVVQVRPSAPQWGGIVVLGILSAAGLWLLAPKSPAVEGAPDLKAVPEGSSDVARGAI